MENSFDLIRTYVDKNPIATLGTIGTNGAPHGAIVYLCADDARPVLYFMTKTGTQKYKNLNTDERVSLTVVNPNENSTLQANGYASQVQVAQTIDTIIDKITRIHASAPDWLPPISKLRAGPYAVIGVMIEHARLAQFKGAEIGSEHIFTDTMAKPDKVK